MLLLKLFFLTLSITAEQVKSRRRLNPSDLIQATSLKSAETFKSLQNEPENRELKDYYLAQRSKRAAAAHASANRFNGQSVVGYRNNRNYRNNQLRNKNLDSKNRDSRKVRKRKNNKKNRDKKNRNKRGRKNSKNKKNRNKKNRNKKNRNKKDRKNRNKNKNYRSKRMDRKSRVNKRNRIESADIERILRNQDNTELYEQNKQELINHWRNKRIGKRTITDMHKEGKSKNTDEDFNRKEYLYENEDPFSDPFMENDVDCIAYDKLTGFCIKTGFDSGCLEGDGENGVLGCAD